MPYMPSIVLSAEAQIGKYDEKGSDVNLATLAGCQLPPQLTDTVGKITKPVGW
jgi:hypothetical protein